MYRFRRYLFLLMAATVFSVLTFTVIPTIRTSSYQLTLPSWSSDTKDSQFGSKNENDTEQWLASNTLDNHQEQQTTISTNPKNSLKPTGTPTSNELNKRNLLEKPNPVEYWMTRLEKILRLQNEPQNATLLDELLEKVSPQKTIRRLGSVPGVVKQNEVEKPSKKARSLPVEVQSDCWVHGKWAVITSIAPKPTKTMELLLEQNWCLVVIGDVSSPKDFAKPEDSRFVYLSLEDQMRLPFEVASLTPTKSFSRKNLGYLFAMSQSAKVILDIDDDNEPIATDDDNGTYLPVETSYAAYDRPYLYKESLLDVSADIPVWNPYPYFNLSNSWPRGYPWEYLPFQNHTELNMTKKQWCLPVIQQYMANVDPDLDAAFRMKFKLPMDYREGSFKRLVLPRNVFSPYNAQATVHLPKAFWSMMLPITVDGRVSDIWRSYITQSLLHLMPEACLMFTSPAVKHTRNPHNYTSDFMKELPLYSQAASMVRLIRNLPMIAGDFQGAFLKIYQKLYETGVVEIGDYQYAQAWLSDLQQIGVYLPRIPGENTWMRQTKLCVMFNDAAYAKNSVPEVLSKYLPLFQNAIILLDNSTFPNATFALAGHNFSNPLDSGLLKYAEHWPKEVKAFTCDSHKGFLQNRCLRQCLANSEGKNAFYMADDDYFNFARAQESLSKDVIWFPPIAHIDGTPYNETIFDNYTRWHYKFDLKRASRALKKLPTEIKQGYLAHVNSTGQIEGHCLADCAYVPKKYHEKLIKIIDRIEKLQPELFSEAGMPLALNLVAPGEEKYQFDPDFVLWGGPRYRTPTLEELLPKAMHLHAVKISNPVPRAAWRDIMAKQYARMNTCDECKCCDVK